MAGLQKTEDLAERVATGSHVHRWVRGGRWPRGAVPAYHNAILDRSLPVEDRRMGRSNGGHGGSES